MKIKYDRYGREYTVGVAEFTVDHLLHDDPHDPIRLERQAEVVAGAVGRLCDILLRRHLMSPDEFKEVLGDQYCRTHYQLVDE